MVRGTAKPLTYSLLTGVNETKLREVVGYVSFERDLDLQQRTTAKKLAMKV